MPTKGSLKPLWCARHQCATTRDASGKIRCKQCNRQANVFYHRRVMRAIAEASGDRWYRSQLDPEYYVGARPTSRSPLQDLS
jgi:hypothetical protein